MRIETERLRVDIHEPDATLSLWTRHGGDMQAQALHVPLLALRDPKSHQVQPLRGEIVRDGDGLVMRTVGPRAVEMRLRAGGAGLEVHITEPVPAGATLPERMRSAGQDPPLQILPGLFVLDPAQTDSGLALPICEGVWVPSSTAEIQRELVLHYVMGLVMGFWSVVRPGRGSVLGACNHAYLQFFAQGGPSGLRWTAEFLRDPQAHPLELDIRFIPGSDRLDPAREFRRLELERRGLEPLSTRAQRNPALANLLGGVNIKFLNYMHHEAFAGDANQGPCKESFHQVHRFDDVAQVCRRLKDEGIDRAMAIFWGWGLEGYDRRHPDYMPANEWAGGDEGLRAASTAIRELGFTVGGHDNYQDIYQAAPSFGQGESVLVKPDGQLHAGGFWAGGRCYIQCSGEALRFAQRNLPLMRERYPWNALFIDTTTAAHLYECHSDAHPRSREDERQDKRALMTLGKSLFGVFGSETGMSWAADLLDYWEGILLTPPEIANWWWWWVLLRGRPIPMFGAIYRDIALAHPHQSQGLRREAPLNFLMLLRSAQPPYYFFNDDFFPAQLDYIKQTYAVLAHLHRRTADEVIVSHAWLSDDTRVERTELSGGTRIYINSTDRPYSGEDAGLGFTLPAYGFLVRGPGFVAF
ncbi:MAG: DUF5696 domain-containing protein, partial [Planctomycetota bacterium]|nr:DUF5696 domain-containing protein [Planctomycetota bacterium]